MLTHLSINNIVLVETLELELSKGLGVLTGETGAGKSILLDAIGLVIGGRGDSSLVRYGADKSSVVATFDIEKNHPVWDVLSDMDLPADTSESIILKRSITADGKSKAYINDSPTTVKALRSVGDTLVDVQGQFDQHGLLSPNHHMQILDTFAQSKIEKAHTETAYAQWSNATENLKQAQRQAEKAQEDKEYIEHCLKELDNIAPQPDEENTLLEAKSRLQNTDKLLQGYNSVHKILNGEDGVDRLLAKTERILEGIAPMAGEKTNNMIAMITDATEILQNIGANVGDLATELQEGAMDLSAVEDRLYTLQDIARKHRVPISELTTVYENFQTQYDLLHDVGGALSALQDAENTAKKAYGEYAEHLTQKRLKFSQVLADKVNIELPSVGLQGAEFMVEIIPHNTAGITIETARASGMEAVQFKAKTNAGGVYSPIHKSASGGELSRLLLAINVALAEKNTATTLLFDEVDAGVGGKSAAAIGKRLLALSTTHQVLVITHSPQVAGAGHIHFKVEKSQNAGGTTSSITPLNIQERTIEIARMLSGDSITQEAKANAETLINKDI